MESLDLRALRSGAERAPEPEPEVPLVPRDMTLRVTYTDPDGKRYEGVGLRSRILVADERAMVSRIQTSLVVDFMHKPLPFEVLPPDIQLRTRALATIAVQLRDPPEWVSKWAGQDDALLFHLFAACEEHAARYFKRDEETGDEETAVSRIQVVPLGADGSPLERI